MKALKLNHPAQEVAGTFRLENLSPSFFDAAPAENPLLDVFVAGIGTVGSELLRQLEPGGPLSEDFHLIGFCNSKLALIHEGGVQQASFVNRLDGQRPVTPTRWPSIVAQLIRHHESTGRDLIFVDATGSREVALLYLRLLDAGVHVVTPSKIANTMPQHFFDQLVAPRENGALFRYEAAAGAGLPIVNTISTMVQNSDAVLSISGVLSGTMTYLFGELENGVPFSEAVRKAYDEGYTEPDPRDDLSGEDVARKCLILARTAGFRMERDAFTAEDQTPESLRHAPLDEFFAGLSEYDALWKQRVEEARADGKVLRYVGTITPDKIEVGVRAVPAGSPIGTLRGADNLISIRSRYYQRSPVTIQGPGAGSEVTAQGALADMRRIADQVGV